MTEPTPAIQLGTYAFNSFNVLDQNMYSSSADNIAAFSNGMAAVADLNKKTNPVVHKIKKAQVGETIIISINIVSITVNFDPSKINFTDDLTNITAALTILPRIQGDVLIPMSFWLGVGGDGQNLQELGRSYYDTKTGALTVNVAKMPFKYTLAGSSEIQTLNITYNAQTNPDEAGFSGTASVKGTDAIDKAVIKANATFRIDAEMFAFHIHVNDVMFGPPGVAAENEPASKPV